jgi:hypothetical protein
MEEYCSLRNSWILIDINFKSCQEEELTGLRGHQSILLPDGDILLIGGETNECLDSMYKFDTKTNTISRMKSMNEPRAYFSAIISQNLRFIYVIGGIN